MNKEWIIVQKAFQNIRVFLDDYVQATDFPSDQYIFVSVAEKYVTESDDKRLMTVIHNF